MHFPCCRFELCVPDSFETERSSHLIAWCFDYEWLGRDSVGSWGWEYWLGWLEFISGRCSEQIRDRNQLLISVKSNSSSDFVSSGSATQRNGFFLSSTINITLYQSSIASCKIICALGSFSFHLSSCCWMTHELSIFPPLCPTSPSSQHTFIHLFPSQTYHLEPLDNCLSSDRSRMHLITSKTLAS